MLTNKNVKKTVFIVVGRLGKSLTISKSEPFTYNKRIDEVFIFRERAGFELKGAKYITIPKSLLSIRPKIIQRSVRIVFEFLQLLWYSFKYQPIIINGVGVKPKGWNSVIVSLITKSNSIFSLIGGTVSITTYYKHKRFWKKLNLWFIRKSDIVTTKGNNMKTYLLEHKIKKEKIFLFNGSINTDKFKYNDKIIKDIDILFVGDFSSLKGPDRVFEIVLDLIGTSEIKQAVFLGNGVLYPKIQDLITSHGVQKYITLKGYVEDPVIYFQRSKIIVIPSISEGLPTAMLEAMYCGCVPVVSNVGNITDAAKHGLNSYVVEDYQNTPLFANYCRDLLRDVRKREMFANNGMDSVQKSYSISKQSDIVDDMLDYLITLHK